MPGRVGMIVACPVIPAAAATLMLQAASLAAAVVSAAFAVISEMLFIVAVLEARQLPRRPVGPAQ